MSDIVVPGFKSSELIAELSKAFENFSPEEKAKLIKQVSVCINEDNNNTRIYMVLILVIGQWCFPICHQEC